MCFSEAAPSDASVPEDVSARARQRRRFRRPPWCSLESGPRCAVGRRVGGRAVGATAAGTAAAGAGAARFAPDEPCTDMSPDATSLSRRHRPIHWSCRRRSRTPQDPRSQPQKHEASAPHLVYPGWSVPPWPIREPPAAPVRDTTYLSGRPCHVRRAFSQLSAAVLARAWPLALGCAGVRRLEPRTEAGRRPVRTPATTPPPRSDVSPAAGWPANTGCRRTRGQSDASDRWGRLGSHWQR